jgi:hypothetical protein
MIVVELDSVTVWWVRQETVPGATFKRKNGRYYFSTDLQTARTPSTTAAAATTL